MSWLFIRTERSNVTGAIAVGETPERKQNSNANQLHGYKPADQKKAGQCVAADTVSSLFNTVDNTDAQKKKPGCNLIGRSSTIGTECNYIFSFRLLYSCSVILVFSLLL